VLPQPFQAGGSCGVVNVDGLNLELKLSRRFCRNTTATALELLLLPQPLDAAESLLSESRDGSQVHTAALILEPGLHLARGDAEVRR